MKSISEALRTYMQTHPFDSGDPDCKTVLDQLCHAYTDSHESDPPDITALFRELSEYLETLPLDTNNSIFRLIGKSIRERHHIAKLKVFIEEFNQGIVNDRQRERYREKFRKNEKLRNQELQYILLILDRYMEPGKSQMLAKMYLAYLDEYIDWDEFRKYSEIIDRLLPGDYAELKKGNQYDVNHMNATDSLLRLIALGFVMEHSKEIEVATTIGSIKIPPATEKNYTITPFGMKFLAIIDQRSNLIASCC